MKHKKMRARSKAKKAELRAEREAVKTKCVNMFCYERVLGTFLIFAFFREVTEKGFARYTYDGTDRPKFLERIC